ncbi:MAG: N-acetylmuramoyl-L-alanine amidase [Roseburia sp.]
MVNNNRHKRKRIRNLISVACCAFCLLLVLLIFRGVGYLLEKRETEPASDVSDNQVTENTEPEETEQPGETETETEQEDRLIVCLDAGHGGEDPGTSSGDRLEKDDTIKLVKEVAAYLTAQDVDVVLTRSEDVFMNPEARADAANATEADYLVSFHRNSGEGYGVEVWVNIEATDEELALAENIMSAMEAVGIQRNRGVKYGSQSDSNENYYVNANTQMPSCLIELGFINDATDNQLLDEHLEEYAHSIGEAILRTSDTFRNKAEEPADDSEATEGTGNTVQQNEVIGNVESLDGTCIDYGHGSNVDENNRPVGAISYQDQYGDYSAIFIKEADSKKIYLTFDEGYEYGYSESILNTLKEKNVKAVFFVTKPYAETDPDLVQRMIDEGHTVGNHSVTHPSNGLPSQTIEQQQNEIVENHDYIKEKFGYEMDLFRFPAGKFSEQSLAIVNNCNYTSVFWSFAYLDYDVNNQPDPTESLNKLVAKMHPGAVYLLHAESATNAAILGEFIDQAREAGYEFAQLK